MEKRTYTKYYELYSNPTLGSTWSGDVRYHGLLGFAGPDCTVKVFNNRKRQLMEIWL